ncbi:helix-turn-helix domain-containing protein [Tunturibacter empetritectus]
MIFFEQAPTPLLRPWVKSLWYCNAQRMPCRRERVLPNGCAQIVISLSSHDLNYGEIDGSASEKHSRAVVMGVRDQFQIIDTAGVEELAGIVIRPGGFTGLFNERADLLFRQSAALEDVWRGTQVAADVSNLQTPIQKLRHLDEELSRLVQARSHRSEIANYAVHLFRNKGLSVSKCAHSIGISERWLSQIFREEVGIAPRLWCRIQRFQDITRSLRDGTKVPLADLASSCGYYDQSHFANDFRAFAGLDATAYAAQTGRCQNHISES